MERTRTPFAGPGLAVGFQPAVEHKPGVPNCRFAPGCTLEVEVGVEFEAGYRFAASRCRFAPAGSFAVEARQALGSLSIPEAEESRWTPGSATLVGPAPISGRRNLVESRPKGPATESNFRIPRSSVWNFPNPPSSASNYSTRPSSAGNRNVLPLVSWKILYRFGRTPASGRHEAEPPNSGAPVRLFGS